MSNSSQNIVLNPSRKWRGIGGSSGGFDWLPAGIDCFRLSRVEVCINVMPGCRESRQTLDLHTESILVLHLANNV